MCAIVARVRRTVRAATYPRPAAATTTKDQMRVAVRTLRSVGVRKALNSWVELCMEALERKLAVAMQEARGRAPKDEHWRFLKKIIGGSQGGSQGENLWRFPRRTSGSSEGG